MKNFTGSNHMRSSISFMFLLISQVAMANTNVWFLINQNYATGTIPLTPHFNNLKITIFIPNTDYYHFGIIVNSRKYDLVNPYVKDVKTLL